MSYFDNVVDLSKGKLSEYGINVLSFNVGSAIEGGRYVKPSSRIFPVVLAKKSAIRPISLQLEFAGKNENDVVTKIAEFTKKIQAGADILSHDGYGYFCVLDSIVVDERISSWIYVVSCKLSGIRHGSKATVVVSNGDSFYVGGMIDPEASITLNPIIPPTDATVKITNDSGKVVTEFDVANVESGVTIDGLATKVTDDYTGQNKFGDVQLFEFPKLSVGKNTVEIAGDVTVIVSYYPLYL